jgi:endoglucanase
VPSCLSGKNFHHTAFCHKGPPSFHFGRAGTKALRITTLSFLLLVCFNVYGQDNNCAKHIVDNYGAIIRGDTCKKQMAIVFTGDEFADGSERIIKTLARHKIKASFFLTGNFYRNPDFKSIIKRLKKDGHYLGAHSDKHLQYNDWTKRDSLLVSETEFKNDLQANYEVMKSFGISQSDAVYFIPPYEWYNKTIAEWAKDLGLALVNFSPGTRSTADYTYPEMGSRYRSSGEIYKSIFDYESKNNLNGFILLVHIGTDPGRTDKFYFMLDTMLTDLKKKGYTFLRINELLK